MPSPEEAAIEADLTEIKVAMDRLAGVSAPAAAEALKAVKAVIDRIRASPQTTPR